MAKCFTLIRGNDESGVSGAGKILEGVVFENGTTVVSWLTRDTSIGIYDSFNKFMKIHVDRHPTNGSKIMWRKDEHARPNLPVRK